MPRRRPGLPHLVQVRQERQHRLPLAAQIHQRFGAAERCLRQPQEAEDQVFGILDVSLAVGLSLGPPRARHQQQRGVGTNRLRIGGWRLEPGDLGAPQTLRHLHRHHFHLRRARLALPGRRAARVDQDHPRPVRAREHGLHALPVVPSRHRRPAARVDRGGVRVDPSAEPLCDAGHHARPARGPRRDHDARLRRARQRLGRGGVGGITS